MDAGNAAAVPALASAADLESGGGATTVDAWPFPADLRLKEKQPFTWLRAAPYLAVILAGAALFTAGVLVLCAGPFAGPQQGHNAMTTRDVVGTALVCTGAALALVGIFAAAFASDEGCCECNLPRFGLDD